MAHFGGNDNCWTRRRERNSLNSDRNSNKKDKKRGSGDALFRETQKKLQNSILKHLENEYESSSDEEELEAENIMGKIIILFFIRSYDIPLVCLSLPFLAFV